MADFGDDRQESQRTRDETEPISIEEPKENEDRTNELGRTYYYKEYKDLRQYLQHKRLGDVKMQRRSHETESNPIEETKENEDGTNEIGRINHYNETDEDMRQYLQQKRPGDVEMQRISHETPSRFWHQNRGQIRDYEHSNANTRENLKRRRRERDSTSWHEKRDRYPDRRGSESRFRFNERCPDWRDWRGRFDERSCHYNHHPTQHPQDIMDRDVAQEPLYQARSTDRRASESEWRFDERTQRRYEKEHDSRERFEVVDERETRDQETQQEQIQRDTERLGIEVQHNLKLHDDSQSETIPNSRAHDPRRNLTIDALLQEENLPYLIDAIVEGIMKERREAQEQRN